MNMALLIVGLVVFLGVHSIRMVAPGWRDAMIARMGEGPWKGIYSLVSLVGFVLLVWGYAIAPTVVLWRPTPYWMVYVTAFLMVLAFISLAVSQVPAGRLKPRLKHPMLLAVKIWAIAHLLVNNDLASIILFVAFLVWAGWNRIAVKRRGSPLPEAGPASNDVIAIIAGLVVWALFVWGLHKWLIGVPVPIF